MTTKEIQKTIGIMQVLKFHPVVCENISPLFRWEMDVMSLSKTGMMYEFEVKVSRSDFKADSKKGKKHFYNETGLVKKWTPNYFSFACPKDLIKLSEIGAASGLYYVDGEDVIEVRKPKRLHDELHNRQEILEKVIRLQQERIFLGCARLTYENRIRKANWERWQKLKDDEQQATEAKPLL